MPQTMPSRIAASGMSLLAQAAARTDGLSVEDAHELMASCSILAATHDRWWQFTSDMLDRGTEGRSLSAMLSDLAEALMSASENYPKAQLRIAASPNLGPSHELWTNDLQHYIEDTRKRLAEVERLREWLQSAAVQPLPGSLPTDSGERVAEGYVGLDRFLEEFVPSTDR